MSPHHVDHWRGFTIAADNQRGSADLRKKVELCPGARIYSFTLSAISIAIPIPDIVAKFDLQDSEYVLYSGGCTRTWIEGDFPGLAFPAYAVLIAVPGTLAILHLSYGNCS